MPFVRYGVQVVNKANGGVESAACGKVRHPHGDIRISMSTGMAREIGWRDGDIIEVLVGNEERAGTVVIRKRESEGSGEKRPPLSARMTTVKLMMGDPPPGQSALDQRDHPGERPPKQPPLGPPKLRRGERRILEVLLKGTPTSKEEMAEILGTMKPSSVPSFISYIRAQLRPHGIEIKSIKSRFSIEPEMAAKVKALLLAAE